MNWFTNFLMVLGAIMLFEIITVVIMIIVATVREDEIIVRAETNADKVRSFDNNELAEFLAKITVAGRADKQRIKRSEYEKLYKNWLKMNS